MPIPAPRLTEPAHEFIFCIYTHPPRPGCTSARPAPVVLALAQHPHHLSSQQRPTKLTLSQINIIHMVKLLLIGVLFSVLEPSWHNEIVQWW